MAMKPPKGKFPLATYQPNLKSSVRKGADTPGNRADGVVGRVVNPSGAGDLLGNPDPNAEGYMRKGQPVTATYSGDTASKVRQTIGQVSDAINIGRGNMKAPPPAKKPATLRDALLKGVRK